MILFTWILSEQQKSAAEFYRGIIIRRLKFSGTWIKRHELLSRHEPKATDLHLCSIIIIARPYYLLKCSLKWQLKRALLYTHDHSLLLKTAFTCAMMTLTLVKSINEKYLVKCGKKWKIWIKLNWKWIKLIESELNELNEWMNWRVSLWSEWIEFEFHFHRSLLQVTFTGHF